MSTFIYLCLHIFMSHIYVHFSLLKKHRINCIMSTFKGYVYVYEIIRYVYVHCSSEWKMYKNSLILSLRIVFMCVLGFMSTFIAICKRYCLNLNMSMFIDYAYMYVMISYVYVHRTLYYTTYMLSQRLNIDHAYVPCYLNV